MIERLPRGWHLVRHVAPVVVVACTSTGLLAQAQAGASEAGAARGVAGALREFFRNIDSNYFDYFLALAALGTLTMAILEVAKTLFGLRGMFHRNRVRAWLMGRVGAAVDEAEREIVRLAADGNGQAFYSCDIETLVRQLGAAAQVIVDNPAVYPRLFEILTLNAGSAEVPAGGGKVPAAHELLELDGGVEARRLRQIANAAVVAFHVSAAYQWQNVIRVASFVVSAGLAFAAIALSGEVQSPVAVAMSALLGAFLAPIARDVVAALQKIRS